MDGGMGIKLVIVKRKGFSLQRMLKKLKTKMKMKVMMKFKLHKKKKNKKQKKNFYNNKKTKNQLIGQLMLSLL